MKTSELTGAALDWAVSKCEKDQNFYSTNWAQGGPIIEREKIDVIADPNGKDVWMGRLYLNWVKYEAFATTPLIAAMRCYVASKLGDEIDLPKELL
jgi:hypothetical protein